MAEGKGGIDTVVFDLGGVLIDWNPRHLYRKVFAGDEPAMETFLAQVCNAAWNERQDQGRPWAEAIAEAVARHPQHEAHIRAYRTRWQEMLGGALDGTVRVLNELAEEGLRLLALTNWSAETFHFAEERFAFLDRFDGVVVSGREGVMKPDPAIFHLLIRRYGVDPVRAVFVDDVQKNVDAAVAQGLRGIRFLDSAQLRRDLRRLGVPVAPDEA